MCVCARERLFVGYILVSVCKRVALGFWCIRGCVTPQNTNTHGFKFVRIVPRLVAGINNDGGVCGVRSVTRLRRPNRTSGSENPMYNMSRTKCKVDMQMRSSVYGFITHTDTNRYLTYAYTSKKNSEFI